MKNDSEFDLIRLAGFDVMHITRQHHFIGFGDIASDGAVSKWHRSKCRDVHDLNETTPSVSISDRSIHVSD